MLMRQIMRGEVSEPMTAAILTGLRVKKETVGEIAGAAQVMREFSRTVDVADRSHLVDIVGTGGDGSHTFNISTCTMFVAAAAGARVAKHGNRSVSSKSGSADALEALGAIIELQPQQVAQAIERSGIGFMFAPVHHPAMKVVAPVRREMGVRTIFNILGPLTNPAGAPSILMGVFHPDLVGIQARVLHELGAERALVVWGRDGMDELSLGAGTLVGELRDGQVREYELHRRTSVSPCPTAATSRWPIRTNRGQCCWACLRTAPARHWTSSPSTPVPRSTWPAWPVISPTALRVRVPPLPMAVRAPSCANSSR